jgi:cytochrome P450
VVAIDIASFDPLSEDLAANHWERLAELRRCPVGKSELYGGLWFLARYDDVLDAARDWQTYSSAEGSSPVPLQADGGIKLMPISTDPPLQRELRRLIDRHFGPRKMPDALPAVRNRAIALIEKFQSRGTCDFVAEFAVPYPAESFFDFAFGVKPDTTGQVMGWIYQILRAPHEAKGAVQAFFAWTKGLLDERRAGHPRDDVLNSLLNGSVEGRELTDPERMMVIMNLIIGGVETTTQAIGNIVYHFSTIPGLQDRLDRNRDLIPAAVEEFLRFEPPSSLRGRVATNSVQVGCAHINRKDRVVLVYGAANRDPAKYESPDEIVIDRFTAAATPHLTFGAGPHRCPGSHLARLELCTAVEEVLNRLKDLKLDADEVTYSAGLTRGIVSLPITFRPYHR